MTKLFITQCAKCGEPCEMDSREPMTLVWSEIQRPNEECYYHHVTAQTPFGGFRITWKGWKAHGPPSVDKTPWGDSIEECVDLLDAKRRAEVAWRDKVKQSTFGGTYPTKGVPEVGIKGLTEEEASQTMSVMGLTKKDLK